MSACLIINPVRARKRSRSGIANGVANGNANGGANGVAKGCAGARVSEASARVRGRRARDG
jgi:hypothetical protein